MQAIYVSKGESIDYTPGADVVAGQVIVLDGRVCVATSPIASGALGALATQGLFKMVKANEEINAGAAIYWDADGDPYGGVAGTGAITTTAAANTFAGYTGAATAGATDATVDVDLAGANASTITIHNPLSAVIADPGDAGAIPITNSGHCPLVTVGAETRTLAAPTYTGQMLMLCMKTDGGDAVVTCATTINETGNNTITFANTGEMITLVAVEEGANKRWRDVGHDGCALSTV